MRRQVCLLTGQEKQLDFTLESLNRGKGKSYSCSAPGYERVQEEQAKLHELSKLERNGHLIVPAASASGSPLHPSDR